ncbi:MAG: rod shape-determining protein MreC [Rhodospirillales bacterium]|nr:rod shape-determining protein MreC [Rhodospirillales bacterium]
MIRLSIPMREALEKLSLPLLIAAAFALMLAGRLDAPLAGRARMALADALTPVYAAFTAPMRRIEGALVEVRQLWNLRAENARLRAENATLRRWQAVALALEAENAKLKSALHWIPEPGVPFVTARAVADAGGLYDRAVLVALAPGIKVHVGAIALDAHGLVGRVTEAGRQSARVLLITDLNSRIPVRLGPGGVRAILAGTNTPEPELLYWPAGTAPKEGEQVVTSGVAGAFPPGLPVGTVHYGRSGVPRVALAAALARLGILRLFDYRLHGVLPPGMTRRGRARLAVGARHGN